MQGVADVEWLIHLTFKVEQEKGTYERQIIRNYNGVSNDRIRPYYYSVKSGQDSDTFSSEHNLLETRQGV